VQSKRFDEAINWLREAVARNSGSARLHSNLAFAFGAVERYEEAVEAYRHSLTIDPRAAQTYCDLGIMLSRLLRDEEAVVAFEKALALRPDLVPAYEYLGYAHSRLGRHNLAAHCFERVLAAKPGQADAHLNYGTALAALGRHEEAVVRFEKARSLRPDDVAVLNRLGFSLNIVSRPVEAMTAFEKVLTIDPDNAAAHCELGSSLMYLGRFEEARRSIDRAIELSPRVPAFHLQRILVGTESYRDDDRKIAALEEMAENEASFSVDNRARLHFGLAKVYSDIDRHDLAFMHLERGNAMKRRLVSYDEAEEIGALRAIALAFTPQLMEARRGLGNPSDVPVFVLGMPRSGTSLIEQILASHPFVFGAGELMDFGQVAGCGYGPKRMPFDPTSLSGEDLRRMGGRYLERLLPKAPSAKRIVDKQLFNFRFIGLIRLVLPNARIVHVRRDPADTCFSCYTRFFSGDLNFAYDLGELGRYYKAYETLMAHWRAVLPAGAMLDVQYESLVDNLEEEARRIVDFCGLEWDGRCLEFHKSERSINTVSAVQVRQPLFNSSIGRWRPYAEWLQPLIDILSRQGEAGP
jgi:tetratricopeptide (TPR) repeat protein